MKIKGVIRLLLCSLLCPVWGLSQTPNFDMLVVDPGDREYSEGLYYFRDQLYIFIDSIADRPLEEVTAPAFQQHFYHDTTAFFKNWIADMGPDKACVWVRVTFDSRLEDKEEWLIQISAGEVGFFAPQGNGSFAHQVTGTSLAFNKRPPQGRYGPVVCLPFQLPALDTLTVYFKLRAVNSHIMNQLISDFDRAIFKPFAYVVRAEKNRFFAIFSVGILFAVAIYHLIIFFYQRQLVSLFFSIFVLTQAFLFFTWAGYLMEFLSPNLSTPFGATIISFLKMVGSVFLYLFSRKYLKLPQILPVLDRIWGFMILVQAGLVFLFAYMMIAAGEPANADPEVVYKVILLRVLSPLPILSFALTAAAIAWYKGNKAAGIYLLAMSVYSFQEVAHQITFNGIAHIPNWLFVLSGEAVTSLIFAVGIASQLRTLQQEKVAAEQAELRLKDLDAFKTRFYTNITHQFRTPLTLILGMADQIRAHPATWVNKGTEMIRRNGQRLLHLVNQILALSKLEAGQLPVHLVRADLAGYLKYIVESFHSLARQKKITLSFSTGPEEMVIDYDPDKVMDMLSNLISNALKFTPEGGKVSVQARISSHSPEEWHLSVQDNGPGIPAEDRKKIFDRFFQSEPGNTEQQGTGLGLALTHELARLLGGRISLESEEGRGSTFVISLPVTRQAPLGHEWNADQIRQAVRTQFQPSGEVESASTASPHKLLIVEDSPDVVTYLKAVLSPRFSVEVAHNGKEGLEKALNRIPDLIVSDIMMPEMDGLEMCRQLKTDIRTSHIPIILLTARADQSSRIEGLRTGADAYLAKPFDKTELMVRINKLIELRTKLQERYRDIRFLFESEKREANQADDRFIRGVRDYIEAHLSDPGLEVAQLCKELGMSRSQGYRKFTALTGQPIAEFIRQVRLQKARQLLLTTDFNVSEVAAETGFKSASAFSRSFKAAFGVRPHEMK